MHERIAEKPSVGSRRWLSWRRLGKAADRPAGLQHHEELTRCDPLGAAQLQRRAGRLPSRTVWPTPCGAIGCSAFCATTRGS